jgi:hypothetical protein
MLQVIDVEEKVTHSTHREELKRDKRFFLILPYPKMV